MQVIILIPTITFYTHKYLIYWGYIEILSCQISLL